MRFAVFAAAALASLSALAQTPPPRAPSTELDSAIRSEVEHIRTWTENAVILKAVREQNAGVRLIHVSVPIMDGGKAIGVISVGIDHDRLQRRTKR